jgi:uncharacterized membrane protein
MSNKQIYRHRNNHAGAVKRTAHASANSARHQDPTTDQILMRARREIAMRRTEQAERIWSRTSRWIWPTFTFAVLVAFFAAPGPVPRKLLQAMGGVCGLRPAHSYFAGGVQLPMESRMIGIYGGFSLTLIVLLISRRLGTQRLGNRLLIGILALFFASMVFDGVNSTLTDLGLPHLYQSTNVTRLVTGLLSGIAIAPFLVWLLGVVAMPRNDVAPGTVVRSLWDLVLPLALNGGFAMVVMSQRAEFYYPIALLSVGGVVMVLAIAALLVVLTISGTAGKITNARLAIAPGALAFLIAFAVLAVTAAARWSSTAAM